MEAYKKWEKKQKNLSPTYYEGAEVAWKAALKWVLSIRQGLDYGDYIEDNIYEELEE